MRCISIIGGALVILIWSGFASPVQGQQRLCGERGKVLTSLKDKYDEVPVSIGLTNTGMVIEVLASDGGSFTILTTRPDGLTCLVSAGNNWQDVDRRKVDTKI